MKTPRLAFTALLAALAAAASAQPVSQPLTPIVNGPAGAGQCVVGLDSCGSGPGMSMDPATEGALVGLGEPLAPNGFAAAKTPTRSSASKMEAPPAPDEADSVAALGVGIGGIINPSGGLVASRTSPAGSGPATLGAAFGGANDGGSVGDSAPQPGVPQNFSFRKMQKAAAAAALTEHDVPSPDAKLTSDDGGLSAAGTRASSNGGR